MKLDIPRVLTLVVASALGGMLLGASFGYVAGRVSPEFFVEIMQLKAEADPRNVATVGCAAGGVFLGGGLGVFAVLTQLIQQWLVWLNKPAQKKADCPTRNVSPRQVITNSRHYSAKKP